MLALPTKGISRSVTVHNVELDTFCDWIELTSLFDDDDLSTSDVVDVLTEENIYADRNMALELVHSAWTEIRRRQSWIPNGSPFQIEGSRISRTKAWREVSAYAFCLLLSVDQWYSRSKGTRSQDYTEQGELFEELTKESLFKQFRHWEVYRTGWSATNCGKLSILVEKIASRLGETVGETRRWTTDDAKDGGLDLLCYRPFVDRRVGIPVYLMQCASGSNWKDKLRTPSLELWTKIITWAANPRRAFATPYAFTDCDFTRHCAQVDGLLLDRYRILAACTHTSSWVSRGLRKRLIAWASPRIKDLPRRH